MNPKTIPEGIDHEDVKAKMTAGLTQDQAVEVLVNQKERDTLLSKAMKKSEERKSL